MREGIIAAIEKYKIIAIVRGVDSKDLIPMAQAMYDGGIQALEITYDATGKVTDQETAKNIALLAEHFGNTMLIGAGTVIKPEQAALTKAAGGSFLISPDTYCPVIEKTRELEMVSIPGALTPSEIQQAHRWGADFVKLFPVSSLGTEYVKAITAPLSHIRMLAVGGISAENMGKYLQAGVVGFGIGSNIVDKEAIRNKDYGKITALAKKYIEVIPK